MSDTNIEHNAIVEESENIIKKACSCGGSKKEGCCDGSHKYKQILIPTTFLGAREQ